MTKAILPKKGVFLWENKSHFYSNTYIIYIGNMKYLLITVLCMVLMPFYSIGQEGGAAERAKHFNDVARAPNDSARMMSLLGLGYSVYADNKPDSAIFYYDKAYAIAKRINNKFGLMRYYACYGDILSAQSKN